MDLVAFLVTLVACALVGAIFILVGWTDDYTLPAIIAAAIGAGVYRALYGQVDLKLHKRSLLLSVVLALPFVACGSCIWNDALSNPVMQDSLFLTGNLVYLLGLPLTLIVMGYAWSAARDHWWAIPLLDLVFILQWVIWGQLLALGVRIFRPKID